MISKLTEEKTSAIEQNHRLLLELVGAHIAGFVYLCIFVFQLIIFSFVDVPFCHYDNLFTGLFYITVSSITMSLFLTDTYLTNPSVPI